MAEPAVSDPKRSSATAADRDRLIQGSKRAAWQSDAARTRAYIDLMADSSAVSASGLHGQEKREGRPLRWTDGKAEISVSPPASEYPCWLEIRVWPVRRANLKLSINSKPVLSADVGAEGLYASVPVAGAAQDGSYTVRIESDVLKAPGDSRALGLAIETLRLAKPADPLVDEYGEVEEKSYHPGFTKRIVDFSRSPKKRLITEEKVAEQAERLRKSLALDQSEKTQARLADPELRAGLRRHSWWQRISIPGGGWTTSLRENLDMADPGWLNTLRGALTPDEGALLRPLPKWVYLKPIMPDLTDKTVLDIGCNNGFFSFAFTEELGAKSVLGVEVVPQAVAAAQWMAEYRGNRRVSFRHADATLDLSIPKHDVVFMSEVHGHMIDPFFGILRALNLARETLIIDGAAGNSLGREINLGGGIDPDTGRLTYHAWMMSDGLLLSYLYLCGVEPERVTRYIAPWPNHICYVIDTTGVDKFRIDNDFQPCNTSFLKMHFTQP